MQLGLACVMVWVCVWCMWIGGDAISVVISVAFCNRMNGHCHPAF